MSDPGDDFLEERTPAPVTVWTLLGMPVRQYLALAMVAEACAEVPVPTLPVIATCWKCGKSLTGAARLGSAVRPEDAEAELKRFLVLMHRRNGVCEP